ncbi:MAG: aldose 1-epimerase family protein [Planctomycetota bacterium]
MAKKHWVLADVDHGDYVDELALAADDLGASATGCSITKKVLQAGLRRGVEIIEVHNGRMRFVVVPTRGMGIWRANVGDFQLGWRSPVPGPVHPSLVRLWEPSGIGWLDGFDELLVRCGLESNGAPEFNENGTLRYPLHGRIANIPAHRLEVGFDPTIGELVVRGVVDEARLFGNKLRMTTTISTKVGQEGLTITDAIENLSSVEGELELLYHINFGPPLATPGARVVLPVKKLAPRDAVAAENLGAWDQYGPETPGLPEAVFFAELAADSAGNTQTLLKSASGDQGVSLRFNKTQLPYFSLWKNRMPGIDGYVTGLEPGLNFPNRKSFELEKGRVARLAPGEKLEFRIEMLVHLERQSVAAAENAVAGFQRGSQPEILQKPDPNWSAG